MEVTHHVGMLAPGLCRGGYTVVQKGAHAAHELGVDELAGALPPEVGVVLFVICIQLM